MHYFKCLEKEKEGIECEDMVMILTVIPHGHAIQITILVLLMVIVLGEMNVLQVEVIVVLLVVITVHQEVIQIADVAVQSLPHVHLEEALFMIGASHPHHIDLVEEAHQGEVQGGVHIVVIVEVLSEAHTITGMLVEILLTGAHLQEVLHIDILLDILSN